MKRRIIFSILLALFTTFCICDSYADNRTIEKSTIESKKKKKMKRIRAYFRYKGEDYNGALRIYREIYIYNENDAKINLMMGKCHMMLHNMEKAIPLLKKAISINPKIDKSIPFYLGQAYQYLGKIDSAITEYNKFKSTLSKLELKNNPVNELLEQAINAKNYMDNPADITIKNLGQEINSEFDDGMPSVTADGKTLIFTSRRPDTKGTGIDPNSGLYYDDIYISEWNDVKESWGVAAGAEGELNSAGHDACTSISPDGNTIFLYRNLVGVTKSGDIYSSTKKPDGRWSKPKPVEKPINTTFFESSACTTPDGKTLYFVSERNGGYGNADIWKSTKIGKHEWGKPVNLGPIVNTEEDELSVFIHPDGKTLFFSSKGHNTMGGYDIFVTQLQKDQSWSKPVNMGYPINTTKNDYFFVLTTDGRKAYITSTKDGGFGNADIYEVDMTKYVYPITIEGSDKAPIVEKKLSILKGSIMESSAAQKIEAEVTIKDVSGNVVSTTFTNESGDYFFTLKGDNEYEIVINKEGFKPYSEKVKVPGDASKTYSIVKLIILEKLPENKK